jgi:anti-sigma regulatory factor (Ser/Thr protein kinase)
VNIPATVRVAAVTCPGRPEEVGRVRSVLRRFLEDCPAALDVLLCASELAANAVVHSDSRETGGTITVRAELSPGEYVAVEVKDDGGRWIERGPSPSSGRGLGILGALATDWGIRSAARGRTVWATFGWNARESWPCGEALDEVLDAA